jgi:hypothetical protein
MKTTRIVAPPGHITDSPPSLCDAADALFRLAAECCRQHKRYSKLIGIAITAEEQQVCTQAGILATKENLTKFLAQAQAIEASADVIGPGLRDTRDTVNELQQVLKQFGYAVNVTGTFDQATVAAVLKFKKDNGVSYDYLMADNTPGVHPFIDQRTIGWYTMKSCSSAELK